MVTMMETTRRNLEARRNALLARVQTRRDEDEVQGHAEPDWLDAAADRRVVGVLGALEATERQELRRIDVALRRMSEGAWGRCMACKREIGARRLAAMPEATHCLRCAEGRPGA